MIQLFIDVIPFVQGIGKQFFRKVSRSTIGQSILPAIRDEFASYPLHQWRQETLEFLEKDGLLDHTQMRSGYLYNARRLEDFFTQAQAEEFQHETFLSRLITIEMAMRAIETSY